MQIGWITLQVKDLSKAKAFYQQYLGLHLVEEFSPAPQIQIAFLAADNGMQVELIHNQQAVPQEQMSSRISLGIEVENYDELLQLARRKNILTREPMVLNQDLECFFIQDADGFSLQIVRKK